MAIIAIPDRKMAIASGSWRGFGKSRLSVASFPSENDTKPVIVEDVKVVDVVTVQPCISLESISLRLKC